MTIYYEITGPRRKQLAAAVGEFVGATPVYQFTPSYAFAVDQYTITRQGNLEFSDRMDSEEIEKLIDFLGERGYRAIPVETENAEAQDSADSEKSEKTADVISTVDETAPTSEEPALSLTGEPDEVTAYTQLVTALCEMAKNQKRITAKDTAPENEKYAFRYFLLRLGFIGKEYSATRKILLRNVPGNSAFKEGGQRHAESN